jgi:hypothetical protein
VNGAAADASAADADASRAPVTGGFFLAALHRQYLNLNQPEFLVTLP